MIPDVNPDFLWFYCFHGRLGNVCYELCHLYDYMLLNGIPLGKLVLDMNYQDVSYYHSTHQYVIRDNLPFFDFFKGNLREDFNDIPNKLIMWKSYKHKSKRLSDLAYRLFYSRSLFQRVESQHPDIRSRTAVHVRRTDFFNRKKQYVLSDSIIDSIVSSGQPVAMFSDDMEYCKSRFSQDNVAFIHSEHEYEDIVAMSLCREIHKTPHSTFSSLACDIKKGMMKHGTQ